MTIEQKIEDLKKQWEEERKLALCSMERVSEISREIGKLRGKQRSATRLVVSKRVTQLRESGNLPKLRLASASK